MDFIKHLIIFIVVILFSSCSVQMKVDVSKNGEEVENEVKIIAENTKVKTYSGWWIYGEGQHIFKDEQTLKEYDLEFPDENMEELQDLYLAVCEMEYFPMECAMIGHLKQGVLEKQNTLVVTNFEILYIQGCGE